MSTLDIHRIAVTLLSLTCWSTTNDQVIEQVDLTTSSLGYIVNYNLYPIENITIGRQSIYSGNDSAVMIGLVL